MKKRVVCIVLAAAMAAGSLAGCGSKPGSGGSDGGAAGEASGGEEGKVINIYSWNDEFRERVEAVYPEVKETSSDGTVTTLNDEGTTTSGVFRSCLRNRSQNSRISSGSFFRLWIMMPSAPAST